MQRTFLSNLTLLMLLNLLIKPCYLLLVEAEIQNRVGAEVFGNYSALISLTFLINIFLDLGINNYTSRTVAQSKNSSCKTLGTHCWLASVSLCWVHAIALRLSVYSRLSRRRYHLTHLAGESIKLLR